MRYETRITLAPGLEISRLGLGTIHLTVERGFGPARDSAVRLLRRAVDLGVDFIDTADSYGPETAEESVCKALHPYDGVTIATKGGFRHRELDTWDHAARPEQLRAAVEGSLRRLRLGQIPLYYLHAPDPEVPYAESLGALRALRDEGKLRWLGISNVGLHHVEAAREILGDALVAVQNYYNVMFHNGTAADFYPDTEAILDECERREWAFVAWEPLGTGADLPGADEHSFSRDLAMKSIAEAAAEHRVSPVAVRLASLLSRSERLVAIPGTSSIAHLEENMSAWPLTETVGAVGWFHGRKVVHSLRFQAHLEQLQRDLEPH